MTSITITSYYIKYEHMMTASAYNWFFHYTHWFQLVPTTVITARTVAPLNVTTANASSDMLSCTTIKPVEVMIFVTVLKFAVYDGSFKHI